jgi:hypothetical protein
MSVDPPHATSEGSIGSTDRATGRGDTDRQSASAPRPPVASALLVTALGVLGFLLLGTELPTWIGAVTALAGVLLGILAGTAEREGIVWTLAGSALAPFVAVALTAALGAGLVGTPAGISLATVRVEQATLVGALVGVGFGLAAVWTGGLGGGVVIRASKRVALTAVPLLVAMSILVGLRFEAFAVVASGLSGPTEAVRHLAIAPRTVSDAIVGFGLLVVTASSLLGTALRVAPLSELASRDRKATVEAAVDRLIDTLGDVFLAGLGLVVTAGSLAVLGVLESVLAAVPLILARTLLGVTGFVPLRFVLVGVALLAVIAIVGSKTVRWVADLAKEGSTDGVLPVCVGLLVAGGSLLFPPVLLGQLLERLPPATRGGFHPIIEQIGVAPVALGAVLGALGVLVGALVLVPLLGVLRVLPERSAAASLASVGLVTGSIVHGLGDGSAATLFVGTAVGIVCWDIGNYGVGIAETTDRSVSSLPVEVAHGIGSLAVGGGAGGLALGIRRTLVADPPAAIATTLVAFLAALVGVILFAALLRG